MHRPIDDRAAHPAATPRAPGRRRPDPAQVDPAVLGALLRPARLAAARRSGGALRPLDPARPRSAAAPACSCPRAGPSPTARTCSARRSSRSPAAPRPPPARCWSGSPCPATRSAGGARCPTGPGSAPPPGAAQEQLRAAARPDAARRGARRAGPGRILRRPAPQARRGLPGERPASGAGPGRPPAHRVRARRTGRPLTVTAAPGPVRGPRGHRLPARHRRHGGLRRGRGGGREPRADRGRHRAGPAAPRAPGSPSSGHRPPESPTGCAARPEPVEFSPGDLPALREAGARYVRDEPSVPVRITGAVVRMRRRGRAAPGPCGCGCWRGPRCRTCGSCSTRRRTGSPGTRIWSGCRSGCSGRLESRGGFRRLTDAARRRPGAGRRGGTGPADEVAPGEPGLLRGGVRRAT